MSIKLWSRRSFPGSVRARFGGFVITPKALSEAQARTKSRKAARRPTSGLQEIDVHPLLAAQADELAAWAAKRWGLPRPRVKFFACDARPQSRGVFSHAEPGAVWISDALRGDELKETTFHEVAHYARHAGGHPNTEDEVNVDVLHLLHHHRTEEQRIRCYAY